VDQSQKETNIYCKKKDQIKKWGVQHNFFVAILFVVY